MSDNNRVINYKAIARRDPRWNAQTRELLAKSDALLKRSGALGALDLERSLIRFLKTDLKVGHTFATIALKATSDATRQRNRKKAKSAYDTVVRYLKRVHLSDSERAEIQSGVAKLKATLQQLGDTV